MKKAKRTNTGGRRALLLLVPILVALGIIAASELSKPAPVSQAEHTPMIRDSGAIAIDTPAPAPQSVTAEESDAVIRSLYAERRSDVQVQGTGTVVRILSDDTDGDRHQRFILELDSGQTLLVAHNTDIAPRLDGLQKGDTVSFYGEYVYNDEGGLIHWTHRDPDGRHVDGWLRWDDTVYQ